MEGNELMPSERNLQGIEKFLNELLTQQKFFEYRKSKQNDDIAAVGQESLYITIVESLAVLGLTLWQVYYIQKMLDLRESV